MKRNGEMRRKRNGGNEEKNEEEEEWEGMRKEDESAPESEKEVGGERE